MLALLLMLERWAVKTLTDVNAAAVDFRPVDTTVRELRALVVPNEVKGPFATGVRSAPVERTVWRVKARLVDVHREKDGDLHLTLQEPDDPTQTMIAEIPDIRRNNKFATMWGEIRSSLSLGKMDRIVIVEGVGFFDPPHAPHCAPNGIELHPVLSLQ